MSCCPGACPAPSPLISVPAHCTLLSLGTSLWAICFPLLGSQTHKVGKEASSVSCRKAPLLSLTPHLGLSASVGRTGQYVPSVHMCQWRAWWRVEDHGLKGCLLVEGQIARFPAPFPQICSTSTSAHQSNTSFIVIREQMAPECFFADDVCPLGF